jgi:DNA ligase (NAD+)
MTTEKLVRSIMDADKAYYGGEHPLITDSEYDALKDALRTQDPNHPIFDKVGDSPSSTWMKAPHNIPMGSLNKVNEEEEFCKWYEKFENAPKLTLQPKIDGLSVSLVYDNSEFRQGITRGDGAIGEDITPNVLKMNGLIKNIPGYTGSIRAEIIFPKGDFTKINTILSDDDKYSNARNAASGISRRLDGQYCKYLNLMPYDMTWKEPINEDEKIKKLQSWGFNTPYQVVGSVVDIIEAFEKLKEDKEKLLFDIDGAVIKVCSHQVQQELGFVNNRPKAQIAWKFDPPGAVTVFLNETWDVGRTGVVTPLAHLEPVEIDGSIVKRATLHNVAEIKRLGIGHGDTVMLVKAGEIIPKIVSVIEHKGKPIQIPTTCPSCNSTLHNDEIKLMCLNDTCPQKSLYRILNWIKVSGIDEFGESLVEALNGIGKLSKIVDIYKLKKDDISNIEGWGEPSAIKILSNIDASRSMPQETFLSALGIPSISDKTSIDLFRHFKTMENLLKASADEIKSIYGFSDISADTVVRGLKKYESEIKELLSTINLAKAGVGGKLEGKSFCFTGAMLKPRSYYQDLVKKNGGKNNSSVTKDLSYLVCNENRGSSKSMKAEKNGVKVITEQEFLSMIEIPPEAKPKVENISLF